MPSRRTGSVSDPFSVVFWKTIYGSKAHGHKCYLSPTFIYLLMIELELGSFCSKTFRAKVAQLLGLLSQKAQVLELLPA